MKNVLIITLILTSLPCWAQVHGNGIIDDANASNIQFQSPKAQCDTVQKSFALIDSYYDTTHFLNQTYNYETANEVRKLKMQKRHVYMLGATISLGLVATGAILANKYNWPVWICIPCETVICLGTIFPFILWAQHLDDKANALESQVAYLLSINDKIDLGVARYKNYHDNRGDGFGIALQYKF